MRFLLFLFATFSLLGQETCFFIPPKGWEIANPEMLSPRVHICFLGKASQGAPSINLATEPVNVTLDAYVDAVRKIHAGDPNSRWRDLGKYKTLMGEGRLTELETPSDAGMSRMVQLIVIKDQIAYILTASASKENFSKFYKTFDQTLRTLQASANLVESYGNSESRNRLKKMIDDVTTKFRAALGFQVNVADVIQKESADYYKNFADRKNPRILNKIVEKLDAQLKEASRRDALAVFQSEEFHEKVWAPFEQKIINDFTEMGPYWQILILKEIQTKLITAGSS